MKSVLFLGLAAAALSASAARADVVVVASVANDPHAAQGATAAARTSFDAGNGVIRKRSHSQGDDVRSYDETVTVDAEFAGVRSVGTASQRTSLTASGDTLSLASTAFGAGTRTLAGNPTTDAASTGGGAENYSLTFTASERSTYVLTGSFDKDPGAASSATAILPDGQMVAVGAGRSDHVGFTRSGVVEPGTNATFLFTLLGGVGEAGRASGHASWNFTLNVVPAAPLGDDVRWTRTSGGGFADAASWDPQRIPVHDTDRADNAVFDLRGGYVVDFLKALGPARTSDRLEIRQGDVTFENADYKVDDLDLVRPSLVVDVGKLTLASGQLTSQSARIGDLHGVGAEVDVAGAGSRWDCLGQLNVGGSDGVAGHGVLLVCGGAAMTSAETRIGAGGGQLGFATADGEGSTWSTGNIAVGFTSGGELSVAAGAQVTSGTAVVGFGQKIDDVARVAVHGVGTGGTASRWDTTSLTVGSTPGFNVVDVTDGGVVNSADGAVGVALGRVGFVNVSGSHASPQKTSTFFCLHDLTVGKDGGTGVVDVADGGEVSVIDDVAVGSGGDGEIDVSGQGVAGASRPSLVVGGVLTVGDRVDGDGRVILTNGAVVQSGQAVVGGTDAFGTVEIDDGSSLTVSGDLFVGALGGLGLVAVRNGIIHVFGNMSVAGGSDGVGTVGGTGVVIVEGLFTVDGLLEAGVVPLGSPPVTSSKRAVSLRRKPAPLPTGTLTVQGNLVVGPTGVVRVEAAGSQSDKLVVTGTAALDGTLVLQFKNGFAPKTGSQFEVVHVNGAATGGFASVETRGLAPGAQFVAATTGGAFTLTAANDAVALPTVSVKASTKKMLEKRPKKKATLTFTRRGAAAAPLTVAYTTTGSATNGLDYVQLSGTVTFPAKKKSAKVVVQLVDDAEHEAAETIDVTVVPGADYTESLASAARITIVDDD